MKNKQNNQDRVVDNRSTAGQLAKSATEIAAEAAEIKNSEADTEIQETTADEAKTPEQQKPVSTAAGKESKSRTEEITGCNTKEAADKEALCEEPDVDALVQEAYLRGRNEAIEELMQRPGMLQPLAGAPVQTTPFSSADNEVMILSDTRQSIWER